MSDVKTVATLNGRNNSEIVVLNHGDGRSFEVGVRSYDVTIDGGRHVYRSVGKFQDLGSALRQAELVK